MTPFWMTSTRLDSEAMNSRFCSTRIMVMPVCAQRCSVSAISSMIEGWMPSVGSSSRISFGSGAEAAGEGEQLLLAARERAALPVEQALQAGEDFERRGDGGFLSFGRADAAHAQIVATLRPGKISRPCGT